MSSSGSGDNVSALRVGILVVWEGVPKQSERKQGFARCKAGQVHINICSNNAVPDGAKALPPHYGAYTYSGMIVHPKPNNAKSIPTG